MCDQILNLRHFALACWGLSVIAACRCSSAAEPVHRTFTVPEKAALETVVGTLPVGAQVQRIELLPAGTPFRIDSNGQILINDELDFESQSSHPLTVIMVTAKDKDASLSAFQSYLQDSAATLRDVVSLEAVQLRCEVVIELIDSPEPPHFLTTPEMRWYREDSIPYSWTVTDPDALQTLTYSLAGPHAGWTIDSRTGTLELANPDLARWGQPLQVQVTDNSGLIASWSIRNGFLPLNQFQEPSPEPVLAELPASVEMALTDGAPSSSGTEVNSKPSSAVTLPPPTKSTEPSPTRPPSALVAEAGPSRLPPSSDVYREEPAPKQTTSPFESIIKFSQQQRTSLFAVWGTVFASTLLFPIVLILQRLRATSRVQSDVILEIPAIEQILEPSIEAVPSQAAVDLEAAYRMRDESPLTKSDLDQLLYARLPMEQEVQLAELTRQEQIATESPEELPEPVLIGAGIDVANDEAELGETPTSSLRHAGEFRLLGSAEDSAEEFTLTGGSVDTSSEMSTETVDNLLAEIDSAMAELDAVAEVEEAAQALAFPATNGESTLEEWLRRVAPGYTTRASQSDSQSSEAFTLSSVAFQISDEALLIDAHPIPEKRLPEEYRQKLRTELESLRVLAHSATEMRLLEEEHEEQSKTWASVWLLAGVNAGGGLLLLGVAQFGWLPSYAGWPFLAIALGILCRKLASWLPLWWRLMRRITARS